MPHSVVTLFGVRCYGIPFFAAREIGNPAASISIHDKKIKKEKSTDIMSQCSAVRAVQSSQSCCCLNLNFATTRLSWSDHGKDEMEIEVWRRQRAGNSVTSRLSVRTDLRNHFLRLLWCHRWTAPQKHAHPSKMMAISFARAQRVQRDRSSFDYKMRIRLPILLKFEICYKWGYF